MLQDMAMERRTCALAVPASCISTSVVSDVAADGMVIASPISAEDGARYTGRRSKFSGSTIIIIMNKKQSARLNAYLAVQTLLAANAETVATLPALDEAADALAEFITNINAFAQVQASSNGAAEAKASALSALGDAVYELAGGVLSFAEVGGDFVLAGRVRFSRSGVVAGSGNAIVARCQDIIDAATANLASLADHGVTQAKLTAAKQKLKAYDTVRVLPRQAKAASAAATRQLEAAFPEVERLLSQRVDKLLWQFRASAPEFYERYQVARAVVNGATFPADGATAPPVPVAA